MEPVEIETLSGPSSSSSSAIRSRRQSSPFRPSTTATPATTTTTTTTNTTSTTTTIVFKRQISNITPPQTRSGLGGACSNLINSIVGAGIIGIPFALKESGLIAGVMLLLLVSYFTDKSLRMLVELASFSYKLHGRGVLTFEDLLSVRVIPVCVLFVGKECYILIYVKMWQNKPQQQQYLPSFSHILSISIVL